MVPTFADFSISPPRLHNVSLLQNNSTFQKDHAILGNNDQVSFMFDVQDHDLTKTVVTIVGLVSRLEPHQGYSPIILRINNHIFSPSYTMPGDGCLPQTCSFGIPPELLTPGQNSLTLQVDSNARSSFWLYRLTVDVTNSIGQSEKERLSIQANEPVFTYHTEHAESEITQWHQAANLMFFIDSGEEALPEQLSWCDQKGNYTSISFQSSMSDFYGYYQRVNEGSVAYRGRLLAREQSPKSTGDMSALSSSTPTMSMPKGQPITYEQVTFKLGTQHFIMSAPKSQENFAYRTEHAWGNITQWHEAVDLRFFLHSGEAVLPVRLMWRDQKGNCASIGFQPDMSSFCGYYQRVNEGPIAYRGKLVGRSVKF